MAVTKNSHFSLFLSSARLILQSPSVILTDNCSIEESAIVKSPYFREKLLPEALDTISLLGEDCECRIEDQTADEVSLDTDYGDIFIHNSNIKNTVIQSKNGDISFKNCQIDILDAALDYGR